MTEYWQNRLNDLDFLPLQNVKQYHVHNMAKNKKNPPKESINIKEFRPKIGIYLPVIRCDVTTVMAIIRKLTPKK